MAHIRFGVDKGPGDPTASVSNWKLAALTFFDPKFATADDILGIMNLLDTFSGKDLDIVLHGFVNSPPASVDPKDLIEGRVGARKMYYDPAYLKVEVDRLQQNSSWKFSFEVDVVLVNQRQWYIGDGGYDRKLDNAISLNLYRMKEDKKITSYASFFQELIAFAQAYQGDNPTWDYSDSKAWKELKKSMFESFKTYLGFRKFQLKIEDYAVADLRAKR